jgi:hypothetical protein
VKALGAPRVAQIAGREGEPEEDMSFHRERCKVNCVRAGEQHATENRKRIS